MQLRQLLSVRIAHTKHSLQQEPHTVGTSVMLPRNEGGILGLPESVWNEQYSVVDISDPICESRNEARTNARPAAVNIAHPNHWSSPIHSIWNVSCQPIVNCE